MPPNSALRWKGTHNVAQPDLTNQYCVGRNEIRNAFISVGQMRADANLSITADFHSYQGMLNTGHCLAAPKQGLVVDEGDASFDSNHVFGKVFCLFRIQRNLAPLVQKQSAVVDDAVALLGRSSLPLSLFKQFETTQTFHGISIRMF